jgi:hypothetical protein
LLLLKKRMQSNVITVKLNCLDHLFTKLRDEKTVGSEWRFAAQRLMTVSYGYCCLPIQQT